MTTLRCAPVAVLLLVMLHHANPAKADYVYGGTELSWEWLTDASRAIVVGLVTRVGPEHDFELRVERVLKKRDTKVQQGQILSGPVLGRAQLVDQAPIIIPEIGWPLLLDPRTYPSASEISDRPWHPRLRRQTSWSRGDRCLVFYGKDGRRPLQVINLDKPVTIEVKFLAVDLAGQTVTQADDLIDLIKQRVAATQTSDGEPRVRSAGINYWPPKSPLDGQDYYYVLAPPEERLADLWKPEILQKPERFQCVL